MESASLLNAPEAANTKGATKKFYKTRAGIGGKLKDADPLVVWYLGLAFSIPAILLVLLPLFECTLSTCSEEDGNISISSVIEYLPLATVYAVLGAVTLTILCYYQLIICKRGWKIIFAVLGYMCLLVPLMLPLSSGVDNVYHDAFAVTGFFFEIVFIILVFIDVTIVAPIPPNGTFIVYMCAVAVVFAIAMFLAGIIVGDEDYGYNLVYEIIAEYLIGLSALSLVKTLEYFDLYNQITRQCDDCCWPYAPLPEKKILETAGDDSTGLHSSSVHTDDEIVVVRDTSC